jgi:hypothetical protein
MAAAAGSRPAFLWQGMVDGVVEIEMHNREVRVKTVEGARPEDSLWRLSKPLPNETVPVSLRVFESRGFVRVVTQPSLRNGYALVIRIEDRQDGRSRYRLSADWDSGMEQVDRVTQLPVSVATELPESSLEKKHRAERRPKRKAPKDVRWEENGRVLKISGRGIWEGTVRGSARIAISERGASVLSGDASGRIEWLDPKPDMEKARNVRIVSVSDASATIQDAPAVDNGYTLTIGIGGAQGETRFELAW